MKITSQDRDSVFSLSDECSVLTGDAFHEGRYIGTNVYALLGTYDSQTEATQVVDEIRTLLNHNVKNFIMPAPSGDFESLGVDGCLN